MLDEHYLIKGLAAIGRCREHTRDIWQAHFGAALIAAYFFAHENDVEVEVSTQIAEQADLMISLHHDAYLPAYPSGAVASTNKIVEALEPSIDRLCWVGHNVIYAALTLKALQHVPNAATVELVNDVAGLVRSFEKSIPGRSWIGWTGRDVRQLQITPEDEFPRLETPIDVSAFVLQELARFALIYRAEAHHDLIGHFITFSQAIALLHDLGHPDLFARAVGPLKLLAKVLRKSQNLTLETTFQLSSPGDKLPLSEAAPIPEVPLEQPYWQLDHAATDWLFGHAFKFPYSYYDHVRRAEDGVSEETEVNFRKLLG